MTRVKLVSILKLVSFLIFIKGFLINVKIIPPQNKDAEVVSVQKM